MAVRGGLSPYDVFSNKLLTMWTVATRSGQWPVLNRLIARRVMAEYDGPCLFTTLSDDGFLFLAYLCGQESGYERF